MNELTKEELDLLPKDYLMHDMNSEIKYHIAMTNAWLAAYHKISTPTPEQRDSDSMT